MDTDLTPEVRAKRVAVARDVLAQLDRQDVPLKLAHGTYLSGPGNPREAKFGPKGKRADYLQSHCKVCMLGAAFLSYARLFGSDPELVGDSNNYVAICDYDMRGVMADVFDVSTLALMESVFEKDDFSEYDADDDDIYACLNAAEWGKQFDSPQSAVKAICESLIANNGTLVIPTQEPANV